MDGDRASCSDCGRKDTLDGERLRCWIVGASGPEVLVGSATVVSSRVLRLIVVSVVVGVVIVAVIVWVAPVGLISAVVSSRVWRLTVVGVV